MPRTSVVQNFSSRALWALLGYEVEKTGETNRRVIDRYGRLVWEGDSEGRVERSIALWLILGTTQSLNN